MLNKRSLHAATRRTLLRYAVLSGAAGASAALLAACGGTATTAAPTAAGSSAAASSTAPVSAATSSAAASSSVSTVAASVSSSSAPVSSSQTAASTSAASTSVASSSAATAAASSAPAGKGVTLQQASRLTGGSDAIQYAQTLYADFNKESPNIKVELTPGVDPQQIMLTRHAGGSPLDFVENDWGTWSNLASKQVVGELTPYFSQAKIPLSTFAPEAVNNYSLQNKVYGLPVSMSVDALAYNVDLFDANGIPHPPVDPQDTTWTMEKFQEIAQKLTKGTDQFGFSGSANGYDGGGCTDGTYFGMPSWDDAAQKSRFDTPEWAKGAQYWLDLRTKYKVQPNSDQSKQLRSSLSDVFLSNKIGLHVVYAISWKLDQIHFKWGLATMPYSGQGNNISGRMYPHGLHMEASSPNKDDVWSLFQWLTKPANGGRYPFITGHSVSPILNGGSDLVQKTRQDQWGVDPKAFVLMSRTLLPSGTGILKYSNWPNVLKQLTQPYADVQAGKTTPDDYGRQAAKIVNDNIFQAG